MYRSSRANLHLLPRWPLAAVGLLALIAATLIFMPPTLEAQSAPAAPTNLAATAGDQSVTLSWNNPGDSTITRYEYNVNHNATGTGNFTGWSPWTAISQQRFHHHRPTLHRPDQRAGVPLPPAGRQRQRPQRGRARLRPALVREGHSRRAAGRAHRAGRHRRRPERYPVLEQPGRRLHHYQVRVQRQPQRHRHRQLHRLEPLDGHFQQREGHHVHTSSPA